MLGDAVEVTDMTMMMMILVMKITMTLVIKMTIMAMKIMKDDRVRGKVKCM